MIISVSYKDATGNVEFEILDPERFDIAGFFQVQSRWGSATAQRPPKPNPGTSSLVFNVSGWKYKHKYEQSSDDVKHISFMSTSTWRC